MRASRPIVILAVAAATALAAGAALAAGPWPGLAQSVESPSGDVRYSATRKAGMTTIRKIGGHGNVISATTIKGAFGIPAVTTIGAPGGLSPDGRLLVLVPPPQYETLRQLSRFIVLSTATLTRQATIDLPGEFGFDAVSPDRRTLYVIQHAERNDLFRYIVRAYDLRLRKLLPRAIVDKRNPGETMRGMPVSRATTPDGSWVYTLYTKEPGSSLMFVHALNAAGRAAFCIDLPAWSGGDGLWETRLELSGNTLLARTKSGTTVARIDTRTLKVLGS